MRSSRRLAPVAALLLAGLLAACTGDPDAGATSEPQPVRTVLPGAPGQPSRTLSPEEVAELTKEPPYTEADVRFMQGMIPHHVQALRMTRLVPERSGREDVPLMAERMDLSQEDEIDLMRNWLIERGEQVPNLSVHDHNEDPLGGLGGDLMPGMLTEEELLELESLSGEAFDVMFLESMIRHHRGAVQMVIELFDAGGGHPAEVFTFANHIQADQDIEINRMLAILDEINRGV